MVIDRHLPAILQIPRGVNRSDMEALTHHWLLQLDSYRICFVHDCAQSMALRDHKLFLKAEPCAHLFLSKLQLKYEVLLRIDTSIHIF